MEWVSVAECEEASPISSPIPDAFISLITDDNVSIADALWSMIEQRATWLTMPLTYP